MAELTPAPAGGPPVPAPRWADAVAAEARLRTVFAASPLVSAGKDVAEGLLLKADTRLPTRSFKVRGIWDAVAGLSDEAVAPGLSTVSAGNTALALAWAAKRRAVTARSLLPDTAPATKTEGFRAAGGIVRSRPVPELFRFLAERAWEREPYAFVHPWIEPAVHRGHASLAVELLREAPDIESVFVPVGGGGLLMGVAGALKDRRPELRVFAVEPEGCCALHRSLEAGRAVGAPCRTVCDGVAVPWLSTELYPALAGLVDRTVLVPDAETLETADELMRRHGLATEPSGALATAGALRIPVEDRGLSVALLTGANAQA